MQNNQNEASGQSAIDTLIQLTNADIDKMLAANREQDAKASIILKQILAAAKRR
jgi:hypothetical protein